MELKKVYFVSGIDTDVGKSFATGYIARLWRAAGESVATMKLVQTGCTGVSEDIATHRRIMGIGALPEDMDGTTCPLRFAYPASPYLAARMEGRRVDLSLADRSLALLSENYDTVIVEGAGGLMVPIDGFYTMIDYAADRGLPIILVTNPRLGSVNHTLLSLEACRRRGVAVDVLAFNTWGGASPEITADTRQYLQDYISEYHPGCEIIDIPCLSEGN